MDSLNTSLFLFFNSFVGISAALDAVFIFFAKYFIYVLVLAALFFILKTKENKLEKALVIFGGAVLAWLISQGINTLYPVARPFIALENVQLLFEHGGYDSFPSGHATVVFALATGFFYYRKSLAWILTLGALLVGLSRIVSGIHFPLDIVGGFALGGVVVALIHWVYKKIK